MAATFDTALKRQISRRDQALRSLRDSIGDTGEGIKAQVSQIEESLSLDHILSNHPWATMGAALGAGVLAAKLVMPVKSHTANAEPQRVIVEVRHLADGQVDVQPVEPPKKGPMDYLTKALAAFQAVQGVMHQINLVKTSADEPQENDPEPATTL